MSTVAHLETQRGELGADTMSDDEMVIVPRELPSPPPYTPGPSGSAAPQSRCNHFLERQRKKGSWHIDTSLSIPESFLPPITAFDGHWNKDIQKRRKNKTPSSSETRPSLMIVSELDKISGDVHVWGEGEAPVVIVAESDNWGVRLDVNAPRGRAIRLFVYSDHGDSKVWIPPWFEGALEMSTEFGDIKMSDGIKAKLTIFSSHSELIRGYIGDWESSGFGATRTSKDPNASKPADAFTAWSGPIIKMNMDFGSPFLGFLDEKPEPVPSRRYYSSLNWEVTTRFFGGLFRWTRSEEVTVMSPDHSECGSEPAVNQSSVDDKEPPSMLSENQ